MAATKTINFLPAVFQSTTNSKFLNATLDQLTAEPNLGRINGYIGRKFAPTYQASDNYIKEPTAGRQDYQLEPAVVVKNKTNNDVEFHVTYPELIQKLSYYGAKTADHDRLFENTYYSYDPHIDLDKFVNFGQYYWLPDGPDSIDVFAGDVDLEKDYIVTPVNTSKVYNISGFGVESNPELVLARGGTYTFTVNQPNHPFWIQTDPGVSGKQQILKNLSSRSVVGVTGNGTSIGKVTFTVPPVDEQDFFINMPSVGIIDYIITDIPFSEVYNQSLNSFVNKYGGFDGQNTALSGRLFAFGTNYIDDLYWTVGDEEVGPGPYSVGTVVPQNFRYGIWQITLTPVGNPNNPSDYIITLAPYNAIGINQKVSIASGVEHGGTTWYKIPGGYLKPLPIISANLDTLYYQDGVDETKVGRIRIVDPTNINLDVDTIIGKQEYTSPNGVVFTNGMKIRFNSTGVVPESYAGNSYYVEGVGKPDGIVLTLVENVAVGSREVDINEPDYLILNRSSRERSLWARHNRWFHKEVIDQTARYNNTIATFDQTLQARRPIIEFEPNLQLLNFGINGKRPVDIVDTTITDPFVSVQGQPYRFVDGVELTEGMRIIFAADSDPRTRDIIWVVQFENFVGTSPADIQQINLVQADDGVIVYNDCVSVKSGIANGGKTFWFDGSVWQLAQQKTSVNQAPLFDVFDGEGFSFSDPARYPDQSIDSSFTGTKIFSYANGTGSNDPVLGFPLKYKNVNNIGDISFDNNFDSDQFVYTSNLVTSTVKINTGYLHKNVGDSAERLNIWTESVTESCQYQNISFDYKLGQPNYFYIDVRARATTNVPNLQVYVNYKKLSPGQYSTENVKDGGFYLFVDSTRLTDNAKVDVLINSDAVSTLGHYQVPANLDLNSQNLQFTDVTLGEMRNHAAKLVDNLNNFTGVFPGTSNLRDVTAIRQGGRILQHSAPVTYAALFITNEQANFVDSLLYASQEYTRFKNRFLELATNLNTLDYNNPQQSVDLIIKQLNLVKNKSFPWFYSDMVPYGDNKNIIDYTVLNTTQKEYQITDQFDDTQIGPRAILVYEVENGVTRQLVKGKDYNFSSVRPAIILTDTYNPSYGTKIHIMEYANTDGNWIPETPTKLGLYPKFTPGIVEDSTYQTTANFIQGHDGSLTPLFGDYRDDILLELELRIYNNIKAQYDEKRFSIYDAMPGRFRNTGYTLDEYTALTNKMFLRWVGTNGLDYTSNVTFTQDPFTWNYREFTDKIDGSKLQGSWRACYQYWFDSTHPDTRPWEMLGFSEQPDWWVDTYGPAPYTRGNQILWNDLSRGYIAHGPRQGIDPNFIREGLQNVIPVSEQGDIIPPLGTLTNNSNVQADLRWSAGNLGPVEFAWRNSSDYPFAVQLASALSNPAKYFSLNINTQKYTYDTLINQFVVNSTRQRLTQQDVEINGDTDASGTVARASGYLNWISDYLRSLGIDPSVSLKHLLNDFEVQLSYRMAGYSDKNYLKVLAEQNSPNSINESIIIPDSDYDIILNKGTPLNKIVYSAVIIEKTSNGWAVSGYDTNSPYFTVIPPDTAGKNYNVSILNDTVQIYQDFKKYKVSVPYGYEFSTKQQVVNFLIGYGISLSSQGFRFDEYDSDLGEVRNWTLSTKEFLFWSQQGWGNGNIIVLSPLASKVRVSPTNAIVDGIKNELYGSKIVNQNFEVIRADSFTVNRINNTFQLDAFSGQTIGLAELNLVQYEHALIFKNTTMFNDVIYQPQSGSRQFRLKLVGFKTGGWTGNLDPQGFVYNGKNIQEWKPNTDYLKGDLVQYKDFYYTAIKDLPGAVNFDFTNWKKIDGNKIKTGLLNNFATNSQVSEQFYNIDAVNLESQFDTFGKGLIGYRNRSYLNDLSLDDTTQVKFYQGFIKQKGSRNALTALEQAQFRNLKGSAQLNEEWAVRVGSYGSLDTNRFLEVELQDSTTLPNPFTIQTATNTDGTANIVVRNPYKLSDQVFQDTFLLNRDENSNVAGDIQTAGYVNIADADITIFDIANYRDLNNQLDTIGSGTTIWVAKDFDFDWNIYRVNETRNEVVSISNALDGVLLMQTAEPHNLAPNSVVLLKNLSQFGGFYKVIATPTLNSFTVSYSGNLVGFTSLTNLVAPMHTLTSVRFNYAPEILNYTPLNGWRVGEKFWVNYDVDGGWATYEKTEPWEYTVPLISREISTGVKFGSAIRLGFDTNYAIASEPNYGVRGGALISYLLNFNGVLEEDRILESTAANTSLLGSSLAQSENYTVASAPASANNRGYIFTYNRTIDGTLTNDQVLVAPDGQAGDLFGTSIAISADNQWLYAGAPNAEKVYVFAFADNSPIGTYNFETDGINDEFILSFVPASADSIRVESGTRLYIPFIDYTVNESTLIFNFVPTAEPIAVRQRPNFRYYATINNPGSADNQFGWSIATNDNGDRLVVGAPSDTAGAISQAGAVYVFDRLAEGFIADGTETTFTPLRPINNFTKVRVNGVEQVQGTDYVTTVANQVKFLTPPPAVAKITVEINQFNRIQKLQATTAQANSQFGYSVDTDDMGFDILVGSPSYTEAQQNSGLAYRYCNQTLGYGSITGTVKDPTVVSGSSIRINDIEIEFLSITLDDVINAINAKGITGITASKVYDNTVNGYYIVISSSLAGRTLEIMPGVGDVIGSLGLKIYEESQVIRSQTASNNEYFGQKVRISQDGMTALIGSTTDSSLITTIFDQGTTVIDTQSTVINETVTNTGAVHVYNYINDFRDEIAHPGAFAFTQQLNPGGLLSNSKFGADFDIRQNQIVVGAPGVLNNSGAVYKFDNEMGTEGWMRIRQQDSKVDLASILKFYLYNKKTETIIDFLDYIDPAKGKIVGIAEEELTYKTEYDPAVYNTGTNSAVSVDSANPWAVAQVGKVWWNLSRVRYIEYEQDSVVYRASNWGRLFPGSEIEVCEWVESNYLPADYVANGGDGTPKYPDNSAYVVRPYVDPTTNISYNKYYYWVKDKTSVDTVRTNRKLPISYIKNLIEDPKGQGIKYVAALKDNAIALYNCIDDIQGNDTVVHIDYAAFLNSNIIHNEWQLIAENSTNPANIPQTTYDKLIDSLCGSDREGSPVPDPSLPVQQKYGIGIRPRQSMFVNQPTALQQAVQYLNSVFSQLVVTDVFNLTGLFDQEPIPAQEADEYDFIVPDYTTLGYINIIIQPVGYRVLVESDINAGGLWTIYTKLSNNTWFMTRVQSFRNRDYWEYADWYAPGFDETTRPKYTVNTTAEMVTLSLEPGDVVKILNRGNGQWKLVQVFPIYVNTVGLQNGTINLSSSLYDLPNNDLGFGNGTYESARYEQNPALEIRSIINTIKNDMFVNQYSSNYINLFFLLLQYVLSEQKSVDWAFKTSFLNVLHNIRDLNQPPVYSKDNQTYYQQYIEEVKPYHTTVREYVLDYTGIDNVNGYVSDFDVQPYYDSLLKINRSPDGSRFEDLEIIRQPEYADWVQNYKYSVSEVSVADRGVNYTIPPTVTITGSTTNDNARARALIVNGAVSSIEVTYSGSGYITQPLVTITGGNGTGARGYALLKQETGTYDAVTGNAAPDYNLIRSTATKLIFDRVKYRNIIKIWEPETEYSQDDLISYNFVIYKALIDFTSNSVFDDNNLTMLTVSQLHELKNYNGQTVTSWTANTAYTEGQFISYGANTYVVTNNFSSSNVFVTGSNLSQFSAPALVSANDRITAYYSPRPGETGKDFAQLQTGIEYPGVKVQGPLFSDDPFFDQTIFDSIPFDSFTLNADGTYAINSDLLDTVFSAKFEDTQLGQRPEDIIVDGGAYIDTYSSHGPEELIPGRVYDTVDIQCYQVSTNAYPMTDSISWRIFKNKSDEVIHIRMSNIGKTTLASNLNINDATIHVTDASGFLSVPGVIFVDGERIVFNTVDLANNHLGQLRRGTQGTGAKLVHAAGTIVTDASPVQYIPASSESNITERFIGTGSRTIFTTAGIFTSRTDAVEVTVGGTPTTDFTVLSGTPVSVRLNNPPPAGVIVLVFVKTSRLWYDQGSNTATNGTGIYNSSTVQANFLKAIPGITP